MLRERDAALPVLLRAVSWAQSAPHLTARAMRYSLVGFANGLVFAGTAMLAVSLLDISPIVASGFGYICSVPLSFVGHRNFTFRSENAWRDEATRFLLVHSCSLAASVLIMSAVTGMDLPYYVGLLGAVVLIPGVNFLVSNFWVFTKRWKGK